MSKIKTSHRQRIRLRNTHSPAQEGEARETYQLKAKSPLKNAVRYLIWLYVLLLIFDGALRKWFLPGLSDVLLVSRVPLVALIYALAFATRLFVINGFVIVTAALALVTTLIAFVTHGIASVAIYGAVVNYFFIPLIFIIPKVIDYEETERIGRFLLWLVVPMTVLISLQFYSPQNAWVNLTVGGVEGEGITGALGRYRPPGTFSFITGVSQFYTLSFAFFMAQYVNQRTLPHWLLIIIGPSFLMAVYGSISRQLALSVLLVFGFCVAGLLINGRRLHNAFKVGLALIVCFLIASQFDYFRDGVETFTARWESSISQDSTASGVVYQRTFGNMFMALLSPPTDKLLGSGLGVGTNVGAKLVVGQRAFIGGEGEWDRIMFELGPLLGYFYILLRIAIIAVLFLSAFRALKKGNLLPWLIFSASIFLMLNGQWGQQTTLGFAILSAGLVLSANKPLRIQGSAKSALPS